MERKADFPLTACEISLKMFRSNGAKPHGRFLYGYQYGCNAAENK